MLPPFSKFITLTPLVLYIAGKVSSRRWFLSNVQVSEVIPWKGQTGVIQDFERDFTIFQVQNGSNSKCELNLRSLR